MQARSAMTEQSCSHELLINIDVHITSTIVVHPSKTCHRTGNVLGRGARLATQSQAPRQSVGHN